MKMALVQELRKAFGREMHAYFATQVTRGGETPDHLMEETGAELVTKK